MGDDSRTSLGVGGTLAVVITIVAVVALAAAGTGLGATVQSDASDQSPGQVDGAVSDVSTVSDSADELVLVGFENGSVVAADPQTGSEHWNVTATTQSVEEMERSNDGEVVYVGYGDGTVRAIGIEGQSVRWENEQLRRSIGGLSVAPNGQVFAGDRGGTIVSIDPESGDTQWVTDVHERSIESLDTAARDRYNAVYSMSRSEGSLWATDRRTGDPEWRYTVDTNELIWDLAFPESGEVFYAGTSDGEFAEYETTARQTNWVFQPGGSASVTVTEYVESEATVLFGNEAGNLYRVNPTTEEVVWSDQNARDSIDGISPSMDGTLIYTALDERLRVHGMADGSVELDRTYETEIADIAHVDTAETEDSGTDPDPEPSESSLQGTLQTDDGAAIGESLIRVYVENDDELYTVRTDDAGEFQIDGIEGSVSVIGDGDAGIPPVTAEIESGETTTVDLVRSTAGDTGVEQTATGETGTLVRATSGGIEQINASTGTWFQTVETAVEPTAIAVGERSYSVYTAGTNGNLAYVNTFTGEQQWSTNETVPGTPVDLVRADSTVYVLDDQGTVALFDASSGAQEGSDSFDRTPVAGHTTTGEDGIIIVFEDGTIERFLPSGTESFGVEYDGSVTTSTAPANSETVVIGDQDGNIVQLDRSEDTSHQLSSVAGRITSLESSPTGNTVYAGTDAGEITAVDLRSGQQSWTQDVADGEVHSVQYRAGQTLHAVSGTGDIHAVTVHGGAPVWTRSADEDTIGLDHHTSTETSLGTVQGTIEGNVTYENVTIELDNGNHSVQFGPDDSGEFAIETAPGEYELTVSGEDFTESQDVTVSAGEREQVTIDRTNTRIPIELDGPLAVIVVVVLVGGVLVARRLMGGDDEPTVPQQPAASSTSTHSQSSDPDKTANSTDSDSTETDSSDTPSRAGSDEPTPDRDADLSGTDTEDTDTGRPDPPSESHQGDTDTGRPDPPSESHQGDTDTGRPEPPSERTTEGTASDEQPAASNEPSQETEQSKPAGPYDQGGNETASQSAEPTNASAEAGGSESETATDTQPTATPEPTFDPQSLSYSSIRPTETTTYIKRFEADLTTSVVGTDTVEVITVTENLDANAVTAFERTVRKWNSISTHNNVRQALDFGSEPRPWIAIHPEEHGNTHPSQLDVAGAVSVASGCCRGLRHANLYNVNHGRLTPSCIRVDADRSSSMGVISDWGLENAIVETVEGHSKLLPYRAPEQLDESYGSVGVHTDVYILGVLTYELLTGVPLVRGGSVEQQRDAILSDELDLPSEHNSEVPPALDVVFQQALATEPRKRYDSLQHFRTELEDSI